MQLLTKSDSHIVWRSEEYCLHTHIITNKKKKLAIYKTAHYVQMRHKIIENRPNGNLNFQNHSRNIL